MIGIVVVGHGTFASSLIASLEFLVGEQSQIAAIEISPNDDMEERRAEIIQAASRVDAGDGVVILTDMFGGTPSNLAISVMEKGKIDVIAGANLPLAIKMAAIRSTEPFDQILLGAQEAGRKYINVASKLLADARRTSPEANHDAESRSPGGRSGGAKPLTIRSKVAKAVTQNKNDLQLMSSALLLLLQEKIESLNSQHPNSPHAKRFRDQQIKEYEHLQARLADLRRVAEMFAEGRARERAVIKSAKAFALGVGSWWNKNCDQICERAFEMGLFLSAVGVCSIAGVGGVTSVIVTGALAGGKPVVDALRSTAKSVSKILRNQDVGCC